MVITACSFPARLPQGGGTVSHRAVRAPLAGRPACGVHPASRRGRSRRVVRIGKTNAIFATATARTTAPTACFLLLPNQTFCLYTEHLSSIFEGNSWYCY